MESALYGIYTLVVFYQKTHSFATLTCWFPDTSTIRQQFVNTVRAHFP